MFFKITLEPFEVFIEHVFSTEFVPAPEMIDFHSWEYSGFLKDPVYLLLIAPHDIPVIIIGLFPLPAVESLGYAIPEIGLELDIGPKINKLYTVGWGSVTF